MITKELVDKINALWHKQNSVGLTDEEKEEQSVARRQYIDAVKSQVRDMLENITIVDGEAEQNAKTCSCSCKDCQH